MRLIEQTMPDRHKGNGQPKIDGKFYTRASSLPKAIDDQSGLTKWCERVVAQGLVASPDLIESARDLPADDYRWNFIAKEAKELAGGSDAADYGSLVHAATEVFDGGGTPTGPDDVIADASAYRDCCAKFEWKPLAAEIFVADSKLMVAGSFDRLVECPDGAARILDIKTIKAGKDAEYAARYNGVKWAVQLAVYCNSRVYCAKRGFVEWQDAGLPKPALDRGIVLCIPRGTGRCYPIDVDLKLGYELAQLAVQVRKARRAKPAAPRLPQEELITNEGSE